MDELTLLEAIAALEPVQRRAGLDAATAVLNAVRAGEALVVWSDGFPSYPKNDDRIWDVLEWYTLLNRDIGVYSYAPFPRDWYPSAATVMDLPVSELFVPACRMVRGERSEGLFATAEEDGVLRALAERTWGLLA